MDLKHVGVGIHSRVRNISCVVGGTKCTRLEGPMALMRWFHKHRMDRPENANAENPQHEARRSAQMSEALFEQV